MSTYKTGYSALRQSPEMGNLLSALERGFTRFGIDFYLVGAVARDVWMMGIHKLSPRRTTGDIDFAVLINDRGVYESLKGYLVAAEGFHPSKENAFVLLWQEKWQVDLLPFGAVEDEEGVISISGTGFTTVHVPGFSEVYRGGLPQVELDGGHTFKFCTLPGIVLLKLIAWDDRPELRRSDIIDISDILHHFFHMYDEMIWQHHSDLFEVEEADLLHIAARVMGRELGRLTGNNSKIHRRVQSILRGKAGSNDDIAVIMVDYFRNTVEENSWLLQQVIKGFEERKE